jgi:hypothetical protein
MRGAVRTENPTRKNISPAIATLILAILGFSSISANSEEVISTTNFHLSGHAHPATIEIVMTDGRFYNDDMPWCGQGEKWEGQFEFRVRSGHRLLSKASVNAFFQPDTPTEPMSFWSPKFKLVMHDYNRDGLLDFNLGQYRACIYNTYRIFTVERTGKVRELPVFNDDPDELTVSWAHHDNSTQRIKLQHGLLTTSWYNHQGAAVVEQRAWKRRQFKLVRSKLADYSEDMENGPKW